MKPVHALLGIHTIVAMAAALLLSASCMRSPQTLSELTYPPSFSYLPAAELRSAMWALAAEINNLNGLLSERSTTPGDADPRSRATIIETLLRLRAVAEDLSEPGRVSQHPALNRNLYLFEERVDRALRGVKRSPPNYFHADSLSGSCFLCHGSAE